MQSRWSGRRAPASSVWRCGRGRGVGPGAEERGARMLRARGGRAGVCADVVRAGAGGRVRGGAGAAVPQQHEWRAPTVARPVVLLHRPPKVPQPGTPPPFIPRPAPRNAPVACPAPARSSTAQRRAWAPRAAWRRTQPCPWRGADRGAVQAAHGDHASDR